MPTPAGEELRRAQARLDTLHRLTPGDFAAALRHARLLEEGPDAGRLLDLLQEEMQAQPDAGATVRGFAP